MRNSSLNSSQNRIQTLVKLNPNIFGEQYQCSIVAKQPEMLRTYRSCNNRVKKYVDGGYFSFTRTLSIAPPSLQNYIDD